MLSIVPEVLDAARTTADLEHRRIGHQPDSRVPREMTRQRPFEVLTRS
jgi:hypothetical protein